MRMDVPVHFSMGTIDRTPGLDDWQLRRSTKPLGSSGVEDEPLRAGLVDDPLRSERHKTILKSIFAAEQESTTSVVPNLSATFPSDMDCDTPIDDNDHTALHWAAALARISIVRALVNFGADMYRGNNAGETPLIRAVLVTNNSDQDAFERLLQVLGPSLRTVDETGRSVLHHAALVAGVKGRASSARYYMESILEYVAKHEGGNYGTLVDAVDCHGDTALNIAARVGNRGLVRMLLDVGADKVKPNKLGLRPGDFGVEGVVRPLFLSYCRTH
jgi:regulatory protein SWI6